MSRRLHLLAALLLLALARPAAADALRLAVTAGAGSAFDKTYANVGARVGLGLGLGLELEGDASWWMGASPGFMKVGPGLTWYAPLPLLRPYVGGFYNHWFVDGFPDQDSAGARLGITFFSTGPASMTAGAVYEHRLSCSASCDTWAPEVAAGVSF